MLHRCTSTEGVSALLESFCYSTPNRTVPLYSTPLFTSQFSPPRIRRAEESVDMGSRLLKVYRAESGDLPPRSATMLLMPYSLQHASASSIFSDSMFVLPFQKETKQHGESNVHATARLQCVRVRCLAEERAAGGTGAARVSSRAGSSVHAVTYHVKCMFETML